MSARGRMTLIIIGAMCSLAVSTPFLWPGGPADAPVNEPARERELPHVSSVSDARRELAVPKVPDALLTRLPVGRGNRVYEFVVPESAHDTGSVAFTSESIDPSTGARLVEYVAVPSDSPSLEGPLRVEYSLDSELTKRVFDVLRNGRVKRGHVILLDPRMGRVLAYASTDPEGFPPTRAYPAASIVKVVTAAAALDLAPDAARETCRYRGSPYRLTPSRIRPPLHGRETTLEGALAMSNNQCFAQLAVNAIGGDAMIDAIGRFGWLDVAAPAHEAGSADRGETPYELGKLGCGLAGSRITPLHAARLAASLASGRDVEPWWVDRVLDAHGQELVLPDRPAAREVMTADLARRLRAMMVRTTTRGTARSAFRDRRGRPKLGSIRVAGKTGNISGKNPSGRYEWFIGAAPAEDPTIAIAVLQVQGHLWWRKSSEIAADVLEKVFCERGSCTPELASRFTGALENDVAPVFLSDRDR